ncbi:MAG: arylesterase [Leptospiraceae bacterium]|nr:arylesterase [Leptospiraceae bacterium]
MQDTYDSSILFLGDSFTEGYLLHPQESFPAILEKKLLAAGANYKVINGGRSGDTAMDALYRTEAFFRNHTNIDFLVLFLGANDAFQGVDPDFTEKRLREIIDTARKYRPAIQVFLIRVSSFGLLSPEATGRFDALFERISAEQDCDLLPFVLEGIVGNPSLTLGDGVHPNPEGMRLAAERLWTLLFVEGRIPLKDR